jgi:hypothetical protein
VFTGIAKADFGKHMAISTEIAGRASNNEIIRARLTTARMDDHMIVLEPQHL